MIVKRITVGAGSLQEANDVADHNNDIGKDKKDRRIIYVGAGQYKGPAGVEPHFYVAIAETEEAMYEMVGEFLREVPDYLLIDVKEAPAKY